MPDVRRSAEYPQASTNTDLGRSRQDRADGLYTCRRSPGFCTGIISNTTYSYRPYY
jgi:hypothetical protein